MPVEYCLCGVGFYRDIWGTITELPVRVEVMESVFKGDDFCRVAIYPLPSKVDICPLLRKLHLQD